MSRALLAVLLVLALFPAVAAAQAPKASLPDVEDEVMCIQCGTALNVSTAAIADRQRAFIRARIAEGQTKEEIKRALVDEFGPGVLAVPSQGGIRVVAWLVPGLLVVGGLAGIALVARRWRAAGTAAPVAAGSGLSPADQRRLDAELDAFDR